MGKIFKWGRSGERKGGKGGGGKKTEGEKGRNGKEITIGSKKEKKDSIQYKCSVRLCALPAPTDHAHGLLTFIEHHKIRALRFASRKRQKTAGIQIPKHPDAIFRCAGQWVMVVRLD